MQIRRATLTDIDGINKLLYEVHKVHSDKRPDLFKVGSKKYTNEELAKIIVDDNRPIFVYVDNDDILGYTFCVFIKNNSNSLTDILTLYIDDLCVDENSRGQHIGKQLYEYSKDFAQKSGYYNLTLNVWSCNASAMKFYESCGLKPQKVHMETIFDKS